MAFTATDVLRQAPHHIEASNLFIYRATERVLAWLEEHGDATTTISRLFPRLGGLYRERVELCAATACVLAERELTDWEAAGMNLSLRELFAPNPLERALRQCIAWQLP
jgi:hypothetical protein